MVGIVISRLKPHFSRELIDGGWAMAFFIDQAEPVLNADNICGCLLDISILIGRVSEATECRLQLVVQCKEPCLHVDILEHRKNIQLHH